jgi:mRNA interferase HigB
MVILTKTKIIAFYEKDLKAKEPLLKWYFEIIQSDWNNYQCIKETFNSVDSVGNARFVFNIGGNKYRIVAMIHFNTRTVFIRFVGTHKEYDKIDCKTI